MFFFFCLIVYSLCDLPVHCEFPDVEGSWTFYLTEKTKNKSCLYGECDIQAEIKTTITKKLKLEAPNVVIDENGFFGSWTLIYDQGFEIVLQSMRFFAFFKYTESQSQGSVNFTSHCDETFVGTYHRDVIKPRHWGCFYGKKESKVKKNRVTYPREYFYPSVDPTFHNDVELVNRINSDPKKTWKAKAYPEWEGMKMSFGRPTHPSRSVDSRKRHMEYLSGYRSSSDCILSDIYPENFDWRDVNGINYVSPVQAQLMCGSCYAFGTMGMLDARQRINTNNTYQPIYSPQDVIDCDPYSQGCDGGFAYLVSKYGKDFGLVEEVCDPYRGETSEICTDPRLCKKRTYVYDYFYVGGYYGATNEDNMVSALVDRGPLAVNINAPFILKLYKSGIFTCPTDAPTPGFYPTDHVVLIVGYGVSSTDDGDEKYWIVKNSWGQYWGDLGGYFLIRKGTNECNIESMVISSEIVNEDDFQ